jgi:hypothetical protein
LRSFRTILKINFAISAVVVLIWVGYHLLKDGPEFWQDVHHTFGPPWFDTIVGELFYIYLFLFDKKISEFYIRAGGIICIIGALIWNVLVPYLKSQVYDSPWPTPDLFGLYVWASIVLCAAFGRRPFNAAERIQMHEFLAKLSR